MNTIADIRASLIAVSFLSLLACSSTTSSRFAEMSAAELAAYNLTVPAEDMIYCGERPIGFAQSISRTVCVTAEQARRDGGFTTSFLEKMQAEN